MEKLNVCVSLALICVASTLATVVDPRGARPVEHATARGDKCAAQREWPFCTDDNWGPKCPSGCRIQGLMDKYDHDALKRIEKIRSLLDQNRAKHRSADQGSKQTFDFLREALTLDSGNDNSYYNLAQNLRQRITDMKIKIDRQLRILAALKDQVKEQVTDMQRLEIDIDIKLRSCKGSCQSYTEHQVDHESYVELNKQIIQLDSQSAQSVESVGTLSVMKSRPLKEAPSSNIYKSGLDDSTAGQQRDDIFSAVNTMYLVLEEEGSSVGSPATISKGPVCLRLRQQSQDGRPSPSFTPSHRTRQCGARSEVALCSDDDWVSKCPSGCRLQGLILQTEVSVDRKLRRVCKTAQTYEDAAARSMAATARVYNLHRRAIVSRHVSELKFVEHAEGLAANLTALRRRSSRLRLQLQELHAGVLRQMEELYRAEVDVDMKLRTCSGSCRLLVPFSVDHLSFQKLQADVELMDKTVHQRRAAAPPADIPHIRLQPVDVGPAPAAEYKTIPTVQREMLTQFEDIGQNRVVLEELLEAVDPAQ